ncbi:MAG: hypothetical protein ABSA26_12535 [Thermoguttaceae bacterium]|jgi:hypothetical protein
MKCSLHFAFLISLCFVLGRTTINAADIAEQSKPDNRPDLKVVNLTIYPAPIPRPAMKYHLLPRLVDQTPGNAAPLYDTVFMQIAWEDGIKDGLSKDLKDEKEREKFFTNADKLSLWLDTPLDELPKDDVRKILNDVQPWWLEYAEIASRRMECEWETPIREMYNPWDINLYNMQCARSLGRIIAMKARLSLAEGKPEDALKTLQMGFALSQHIGKAKEPLVSYLVGLSIAGMMRDQLLDLTQLKDAPNLYWSLSNLPHPFLNPQNAIEWEELAMKQQIPAFQEAKKGHHSPEQWQKLAEETVDKANYIMGELSHLKGQKTAKSEKVDAKKMLEKNYPIARDYLIKLGWPEKEIQSMAPAHVALLYGAEIWEEMHDDDTKWMGINYSQWPGNLREHYSDLLKKYGQNPLLQFLPAYGVTARAQARTEKAFESLRCIEAIRLYAYSHDGKLPGSLDDIKEVPIPPNPMTGKPFSYHVEGNTAVLLADGDLDMRANYEYRIKIAK